MKKTSFLTFLFSIIPGCGLMYLGYMKKGLQVMLMFAAAGFFGMFFSPYNISWLAGFFFMMLPIIWFYQIFDAMHTVVLMNRQGIDMPEDDGFYLPDKVKFSLALNRTLAKIVAGILIVGGSLSLIMVSFSGLGYIPGLDLQMLKIINNLVRYNLIPAIVSIALIIAGIKLLRGKKAVKADDAYEMEGDLP
ncbi:MAG: hypothetical protein FWF04_05680 [Clostridiales bacterium]|nr:hypothetical protein [Clostridiales bacterium]